MSGDKVTFSFKLLLEGLHNCTEFEIARCILLVIRILAALTCINAMSEPPRKMSCVTSAIICRSYTAMTQSLAICNLFSVSCT